ncbi:MAG: cache domain-containing protein [Candidatus Moranbacteria bacterium]|nr:cache domain-containing protein [Candidatus Moranbacteria bacterium]
MEKINIQEQSMFLAKLTAVLQEQTINETREFLSFLSKLPQLQDSESSKCDEILAKLLKQYKEYTNITLLGADGNLICSGLENDQSINVAYQPYFQRMLEERDFITGKYVAGTISNKPIIPFIQPIFNSQGEIKSAVVAFRDLSWLYDLNSKISLPYGTSLLIFDENGVVLDCFSEEKDCVGKNLKGKSLVRKAIENGNEGAVYAEGLDENEKIYLFISTSPDSSQDKIYIAVGREDVLPFSVLFSNLLLNFILLLAVAILAWLVAKKECSSCSYYNPPRDEKDLHS